MDDKELNRIIDAERRIDKALEALGESATKEDVAKWIKDRYSLDISCCMLTYADLSDSDQDRYMAIVNKVERNRDNEYRGNKYVGNRIRVTPRRVLSTISTAGWSWVYYGIKDNILIERRMSRDFKFLDLMFEFCSKYGKPAVSISDFPNFPRIPFLMFGYKDWLQHEDKTFLLFGAELRRNLETAKIVGI